MNLSPVIAKKLKRPQFPSWALGLFAASLASFPWPAQCATPVVHNVVQEFSSVSNPNGPWSYLFARSLASKGEINGEYALLEIPNPGKNDTGWGPPGPDGQSFSLFQLTDDKGGQYWVPSELSCLALHASTLPTDGDHWQAAVLAWTAPSDGTVDINYTVKNIAANSSAEMPADDPVGIELGKFAAGSLDTIYPLTPLAAGETTTLNYPGIAVNKGDQIQFYRDAYVNQRGLILFDDTSTLTFSPASSSGMNAKKTP
jgi:hypothetical protein